MSLGTRFADPVGRYKLGSLWASGERSLGQQGGKPLPSTYREGWELYTLEGSVQVFQAMEKLSEYLAFADQLIVV